MVFASAFGQEKQRRTMVVSVALCIILFAAGVLLVLPTIAWASGLTELATLTVLTFKNSIYDIAQGHGKMVVEIFTTSAMTGMYEGSTADIINNVMKTVQGFAVGIVFIYMLVGIISKAKDGHLNFDEFLKVFVRVGAAVTLVMLSDDLLTPLQGFCTEMIKSFGESMEKITTSTDLSFLDSIFSTDVTIEGGTIFTYLLMFISFLLAKLLSLLFGLLLFVIIKLTSYVVILEIAVRKVFFPLAIADVAVEGIRSIGIRYLKRFVAVYLRIIIMAASFYFSSALAVEDLKEVLTSQFSEGSVSVLFSAGFMFQVYGTAALYDFIALRFTRRTDELAREALGA